MIKKCIGFLFGALLIGLPFEHHCYHIFRPLSRSFLHKFEALAPFTLHVPKYFEKHIHFYLSDVLILIALALTCFALRPRFKEIAFGQNSRFLSFLWIASLLSLVFSLFSRYYYQYFNLINLAIIFCGFHAARLFFQDRQKMVKMLLLGFALMSFFQCFVGIWQFFTQGPLGVFILGELPLHIDGPHLTAIPLTDQTRKLIEFFHVIPETRDILLRAYGTFMHPNVYGEYMAISLMVSYFIYMEAKKRAARSLVLALTLLQIFCLCLSFSRAAVLSWVVGSVLWFSLLHWKSEGLSKKKMVPIACVALGSLIVSFAILFPHFAARGGFFTNPTFVQNADSTRIAYHTIALNMMQSHPLFGIGYNCFIIAPDRFFPADPDFVRTWTHNIYMLVGSETGLLGLGCFLLFIFSLLRSCIRKTFTPLSATLLAIFMGFLVVGLFDFYFLVVQSGKLMFFLFAGLLASQLATKVKVLPAPSQA